MRHPLAITGTRQPSSDRSEMSEEKPTPGQAAYEARLRSRAARLGHAYGIGQFRPTWDRMGDADRADEEAGAKAAIETSPELAIALTALRQIAASGPDEDSPFVTLTRIATRALDEIAELGKPGAGLPS